MGHYHQRIVAVGRSPSGAGAAKMNEKELPWAGEQPVMGVGLAILIPEGVSRHVQVNSNRCAWFIVLKKRTRLIEPGPT